MMYAHEMGAAAFTNQPTRRLHRHRTPTFLSPDAWFQANNAKRLLLRHSGGGITTSRHAAEEAGYHQALQSIALRVPRPGYHKEEAVPDAFASSTHRLRLEPRDAETARTASLPCFVDRSLRRLPPMMRIQASLPTRLKMHNTANSSASHLFLRNSSLPP